MIGRTLGPYRILEQVGQGGMGTVYLAEDTQLHRRVAIKVISGAAHTDPAARARFLQEARAAATLDHANIGAIHQIGETPESAPFLVMAYYDGETLDRRIDAGPMRIGEALAIAAQVAEGLAHAHARGIVHRDIKPANILRTRDGVVKILDFGLAKVTGTESMTVTGVSIGTPSYMSPEQVRAEPVDARSDVWAVGVLVYALLVGRSPFQAENLAATTYAILEGRPEPLAKLLPRAPAGLQPIVDRCLAKRPADRYADARALAADLRALANALAADESMTLATSASGARTLQIPSPSQAGRRAPVSGAVLGGIAAAAIVAGAGLAALVWQRAHPPEPLRVAVATPEIAGGADSADAALAATTVVTAALGQLADLRGVASLDAADVKGVSGPVAAGRAVGAREVVSATLAPAREEWRVTLRRWAVTDSSVRWTSSFGVTRDPRTSIAEAVRARIATAFAEHRPRAGVAALAIEPAAYDGYLRLERSFRANKGNDIPRDSMVRALEALRVRAPKYLDLHLLEARYALYQFETRKGDDDFALARAAIERARAAAPDDPRPENYAFEIALLAGDLDAADSVLVRMRRREPGSVEVEFAEARLAEKRGRIEEALAGMKRVVARQPSRAYYERLVRTEYSQGRYAEARSHLEFLMAREPDYVFPRSYLAQLELLYGSPARAETLYRALAEKYPRLVYLSNLGLAQMLLGRYEDAARSNRRALETGPNESARLNLADAEWLLGRRDTALVLYRGILTASAAGADSATPGARLVRAQCLAHLGRQTEAIAQVQAALRESGDDPDARFQSSLVYALAGERTSALVNAQEALRLGMQPRWFRLPWFAPLQGDAKFAAAITDRAAP